jgi:putative hydrolase of the HAD superfamily
VPHSSIKAIWSDFGGVLTPSLADTFRDFSERTGIKAMDFLTAMQTVADGLGMPLMAPLDTGRLTEREWGARMGDELVKTTGVRYDLTNFSALWFADRPANQPMVDYLAELRRRGYLVGMLTNNVREWEPYWRAMLPVESVFDAVVNSCDVGCRKPEPAMFRLAEQRLDVRPDQCVLIDDLAENCAGARDGGWQAVLFTDNDKAVADLEALLAEAEAEVEAVGGIR